MHPVANALLVSAIFLVLAAVLVFGFRWLWRRAARSARSGLARLVRAIAREVPPRT